MENVLKTPTVAQETLLAQTRKMHIEDNPKFESYSFLADGKSIVFRSHKNEVVQVTKYNPTTHVVVTAD